MLERLAKNRGGDDSCDGFGGGAGGGGWNPEDDLVDCATDAFGEISFTPKVGSGNIQSPAKVRKLINCKII